MQRARFLGTCWGDCPVCGGRNEWLPQLRFTVEIRGQEYELLECALCHVAWILREQFEALIGAR